MAAMRMCFERVRRRSPVAGGESQGRVCPAGWPWAGWMAVAGVGSGFGLGFGFFEGHSQPSRVGPARSNLSPSLPPKRLGLKPTRTNNSACTQPQCSIQQPSSHLPAQPHSARRFGLPLDPLISPIAPDGQKMAEQQPEAYSASNPPALDAAGMTAVGITAESLMLDKSKIPRYVGVASSHPTPRGREEGGGQASLRRVWPSGRARGLSQLELG